uniref:Rad52/22 family double-strand break repair protein n=1 Tax=Siphoviridae sp. ctmIh35 TaxID=2827932 RepID=A0A8S5T8J5_9CAUD|nr:MAG TPA: Rad52/22 family double-strand break repair protein [Caudoviricetes sp.]DAF59566.1 MAG TPA: Rad52/22 family double-strand break repair protein [Siphoviridae sp. ctmIh35]
MSESKNLMIYEATRKVPDNAQKPITAGRLKGKTDINPMWRIKALTEQFGPCGVGWYYETIRKWIEESEKEAAAFVDIKLYIKVDGEWSKPIEGTGGSMFKALERGGLYTSDECFKMATTDAISVACKQLGIGADIYWGADSTKYTKYTEPQQAEAPLSDDGDKPADEAKLKTIESICKKHGFTPEAMCKSNGLTWPNITNERAACMLKTLKEKYKDE